MPVWFMMLGEGRMEDKQCAASWVRGLLGVRVARFKCCWVWVLQGVVCKLLPPSTPPHTLTPAPAPPPPGLPQAPPSQGCLRCKEGCGWRGGGWGRQCEGGSMRTPPTPTPVCLQGWGMNCVHINTERDGTHAMSVRYVHVRCTPDAATVSQHGRSWTSAM